MAEFHQMGRLHTFCRIGVLAVLALAVANIALTLETLARM